MNSAINLLTVTSNYNWIITWNEEYTNFKKNVNEKQLMVETIKINF